MNLSIEEIRALGQCLNDTWGKSSDNLKITHQLAGNKLDLQMQAIMHFAGERSLQPQVVNQRLIANDIFADALKRVKADFKDITGKALGVKELSRDDDVELIQATSNSPRKIAYYRCLLKLEIS